MLKTMICFDRSAVTGSLIAELIEGGLGFEPKEFDVPKAWRVRRGRYREKKHLAEIAKRENVDGLSLRVSLVGTNPCFDVRTYPDRFQAIYWRVRAGVDVPSRDQIEQLSSAPGFNAAYVCDDEDVFWQTQRLVCNYETSGRPHEHLAKIRKEDDALGPEIDIYQNPGARYPFPGGWLMAGWRMWFGGRMLRYLPKERLLGFRDADEVREVQSSGAVYVQLFDDPTRVAEPEPRRRQRAFREWVGLVELAKNPPEEELEPVEPDGGWQMDTGTFPHGGVRRLTEFLDEHGHVAGLATAVRKIVTEIGPDDKLVWFEETDLMTGKTKTETPAAAEKGQVDVDAVEAMLKDIDTYQQEFAQALGTFGPALDYSVESLKIVEALFEEDFEDGQPKPDGFFAEHLGAKAFGAGAYIGEVIIRNSADARWVPDESEPQNEINIAAVSADGGRCWPVQRVMKRIKGGSGENLYGYVKALVEDHFRPAKAAK